MLSRLISSPLWLRAGLIYLALRTVSELLLAQAAIQQAWTPGVTGPREGDVDLALNWDGQWYQRIAEDGYPDQLPVGPDGRVQQNPWAFYPLYPLLTRAGMALTHTDFATMAPLISWLAGLGAGVVMAYLFRDTLGRSISTSHPEPLGPPGPPGPPREGLALAGMAVWAACPVSPVLQLAYTESLSMLLLCLSLWLLVREKWWPAAAVIILLGLSRPIALPLLVVVLVAVGLRWWQRGERPLTPSTWLGLAGVLGATGASGLLWSVVAWQGTGQRDAYTSTMTAWRAEGEIQWFKPWWDTFMWAKDTHEQMPVLLSLSMLGALAISALLLVPGLAPQIDIRLRVWCAAYAAYLFAVVDGHTSIFRYLIPLFPLALVCVGAHRGWRDRAHSAWWRWRTMCWVSIGVVGQVWWIWWLVLYNPPAGQMGDWPP